MRSKIRCPACRKGVVVSSADAGRPVLCLACGRSFVAPQGVKPARVEGEAMLAALLGKPADSNGNGSGSAHGNGDGDGEGTSGIAAPGDTAVDAPAADTNSGAGTALAIEVAERAHAEATRATSVAKSSVRTVGADEVARWRRWAAIGWGLAALLAIGWLLQNVARQAPPATPDKVAVAPASKSSFARDDVRSATTKPHGAWPAPHVEPSLPRPTASLPGDDAGAPWDGDGPPDGPSSPPTEGADTTSSSVVEGAGPADDAWDPAGDATGPEAPPLAGDGSGGSASVAAPPPGDGFDDGPAAKAAPAPSLTSPTTKTAPPIAGSSMTSADWRPVLRRRPALRPIPAPAGEVSDGQIENAIRRAVNFLLGQFDKERGFGPAAGNPGVQSLATYALIQAGLTVKDERLDPRGARVSAMLEALKRLPVSPNYATYHRSVRATALALLNRPQDRKALNQDVRRLVAGHVEGGYTYALPDRPKRGGEGGNGGGRSTDNSNSQYGLLGVWSGAEAGVEVPGNYWEAVNKHWTDGQLTDGSWPYAEGRWAPGLGGEGYASMAAAGTASLFVAYDHISRRSASIGRDPFPPALERAMNWWETSNTWLAPVDPHSPFGSRFWGYQLYGIERVGLASGFKYFGNHDWYRKLAGQAVSRQGADGSWMGDAVNTSYVLLFLARGRPPIMMNKLRFDGFWANRPRDLANLARFATHATERPLNWQVVDLRNEWHDWLDAPILYVASHLAPAFTDEHHDKLREYALAGGMIFTHADGGRHPFNDFAEDLARALFPRYEFVDLPPDHAIYSLVGKVEPKPKLQAVSNGSRILMLHSPTDLSQAWQTRDDKRRVGHFNLGLNLFYYATGKRDMRSRLDSPYVPAVNDEEVREQRQRQDASEKDDEGRGGGLRVARLKYGGRWDPEPGAWARFSRAFHRRTGTPLEAATVELSALTSGAAPIAHLTGTARYEPTPDEVKALRSYVEGGGVLLIDNCGGTGGFAVEMKDVLGRAFPAHVLDPVRGDVPFLQAGPPGMTDVTKPRYRPFAAARQGDRPGLYGFRVGAGAVLLTTLDVTSGLLRAGTWGVAGYDPAYCESLVQNLILWAHDTRPD